MTETDIRDLRNHVHHFGSAAVVQKRGRQWWVSFREYGCPAPFKTKREAMEWASNWVCVARPTR